MSGNAVIDAITASDHALLERLLAGGADPNTVALIPEPRYGKVEYCHTPLQWAARRLDDKSIRLLLKVGANPNRSVSADELPLLLALDAHRNTAQNNKDDSLYDCIKSLLAGGANPNVGNAARARSLSSNPLFYAVGWCGSERLLTLLLDAGASPFVHDGEDQDTPLHKVSDDRDIDLARCLMRAGADPFMCNKKGDAPIHRVAGSQSSLETLKLYLNHVSPEDFMAMFSGYEAAYSNLMKRVLARSINHCSIDNARYLLGLGAKWGYQELRATDEHLLTAIKQNQYEMVDLLLEYGVDPTRKGIAETIHDNKYGLLKHLLCSGKTPPELVCDVLVSYYMPSSQKSQRGVYRPYSKRPSQSAQSGDYENDHHNELSTCFRYTKAMDTKDRREFLQAILTAGIDVLRPDQSGDTLLHHLCRFGAPVEDLKMLTAVGADANARNHKGESPLLAYLSNAAPPTKSGMHALISAGADIHAADDAGRTVLQALAENDADNESALQAVEERLLDLGAEPHDAPDPQERNNAAGQGALPSTASP